MTTCQFLYGLVTTPIVVGLALLFGKLWAGRILERDRAKYEQQVKSHLADLEARASKELFVHRLQFEKEFDIYKVLWDAALELARAAQCFRTVQLRGEELAEDPRDRLKRAHAALNETIFPNRPFYAPDVYETAKRIVHDVGWVAHIDERLEHETGRRLSQESTEKRIRLGEAIEGKLNELNQLLENLCDAIRERIWSTRSSGWDRSPVTGAGQT